MSTPPIPPSGPVLDPQPPVKNLEFKAGVLLLLLLTLLVGFGAVCDVRARCF